MKYALKKSILQFSIVSATTAIALSTATNAWSANLSFVSSRGALGADDFVDWSKPITLTNERFPAIFNIQSDRGSTVTGTQVGGIFGPSLPNTANVRKQSSTPYTVGSNSPSNGNAVYRSEKDSQGNLVDTGVWNGNFAGGDNVYWNNSGNGRVTLSFATPVSAVGTQLNRLFYSNYYGGSPDFVTDFIGTITANYGNGLSQTFSARGRTDALADNSAKFFGVSSDSADITSVVFDTLDLDGRGGYFNYAINRVDIRTTAVPEPFSILGTLFGGAAALKMRKRFKATNKL